MLDLNELRVFTEVIQAGGFLRASKVLRVSQSAVSQSIANLERKIGEKVLERSSPVKPTIVGAHLLRSAQHMLAQEKFFVQDLDRIKRGYTQTLDLAVDHLTDEYFCNKYIKRFHDVQPESSLRVTRLAGRKMIPMILEGSIELGFGAFQKTMHGLKCYRLFDEESYLVTAKANPAFKIYSHDPFAFMNSTVLLASFIDAPQTRPSRKKIRDYFANVWEIDSIGMQIRLLSQGMGVTYLPKTIYQAHPLAKKFIVLDKVPFFRVKKPYGIYHSSGLDLSLPAKTFIELAQR